MGRGVSEQWVPDVGLRSQPQILVPGRVLYLEVAARHGLGLYVIYGHANQGNRDPPSEESREANRRLLQTWLAHAKAARLPFMAVGDFNTPRRTCRT
jgi:hypothetical protein